MSKEPLTYEQSSIKELKTINERLGCLILGLVVLPLIAGVFWFFS